MRPAATPSAKIHSCLLHSGAQAWLKTANQHSLHTCQRSTRTLTVRNVIHRHYHRCPEAHGRYTKSTAALPAAQEPAHIDLLGYPPRAQNTMLHAAQEIRRYARSVQNMRAQILQHQDRLRLECAIAVVARLACRCTRPRTHDKYIISYFRLLKI